MTQFFALLATHWLGDFVLQTHWQASNKGKRIDALIRHVAIYTAVLSVASVLIFGARIGLVFFIIANCSAHFGTDFFTSRWSSRLWDKQDWHNFLVVVGL